ncbi:hypothetical protein K491DRAFT_685549 [Lophiostoma macrostomum CBS 122681]|uniref:DUF1769-domain-containing protein n=1 Tax=Lophiostoma macrostomum CBS 122681 TaxID=1314788 RepID=A0A6A6SML9_9PLEO|nr:hypothetical protein K491DRAFT_685549 [Lophiostoma macrostomum CBS 122681]
MSGWGQHPRVKLASSKPIFKLQACQRCVVVKAKKISRVHVLGSGHILRAECPERSGRMEYVALLADPDPDSKPKREKVPGDNPAYYTREKACDQLFAIEDFTVSPNPARIDHRIFFYMLGNTGPQDLPGLANATIELWANRVNFPDEPEYTVKRNLSDLKPFSVRSWDDAEYGGPLIPGINEIVGDLWFMDLGPGHGTVVLDVEAVARLPDGKVLFAFEARVLYERRGWNLP